MKILIIQQRYGIGDLIIFLPYIHAISKKFNTKLSILVKESSKASDLLSEDEHIDEIIILDKKKDGLSGFLRLSNELKKRKFDKVFIFNSSLRYNLISRLAGIKEIFQYPLFEKQNQHITESAKKLIKRYLDIETSDNPEIQIDNDLVQKSAVKFNIND